MHVCFTVFALLILIVFLSWLSCISFSFLAAVFK